MIEPDQAQEPVGPQAAAKAAIEVEAVPDDGAQAGPGSNGQAAGGAPAPDANVEEWFLLLCMAVGGVTEVACMRWPELKTSEEEVRVVARAWAPICARRWPIAITPEIVAALITLGVFAPKVKAARDGERERRKAAAARRAREKEQTAAADPSRSSTSEAAPAPA